MVIHVVLFCAVVRFLFFFYQMSCLLCFVSLFWMFVNDAFVCYCYCGVMMLYVCYAFSVFGYCLIFRCVSIRWLCCVFLHFHRFNFYHCYIRFMLYSFLYVVISCLVRFVCVCLCVIDFVYICLFSRNT